MLIARRYGSKAPTRMITVTFDGNSGTLVGGDTVCSVPQGSSLNDFAGLGFTIPTYNNGIKVQTAWVDASNNIISSGDALYADITLYASYTVIETGLVTFGGEIISARGWLSKYGPDGSNSIFDLSRSNPSPNDLETEKKEHLIMYGYFKKEDKYIAFPTSYKDKSANGEIFSIADLTGPTYSATAKATGLIAGMSYAYKVRNTFPNPSVWRWYDDSTPPVQLGDGKDQVLQYLYSDIDGKSNTEKLRAGYAYDSELIKTYDLVNNITFKFGNIVLPKGTFYVGAFGEAFLLFNSLLEFYNNSVLPINNTLSTYPGVAIRPYYYKYEYAPLNQEGANEGFLIDIASLVSYVTSTQGEESFGSTAKYGICVAQIVNGTLTEEDDQLLFGKSPFIGGSLVLGDITPYI